MIMVVVTPFVFLGRQEEVEQAELEQAIAMSLALEAKRAEYATLPDGSEGGGGLRAGTTLEGSAVSQNYKGEASTTAVMFLETIALEYFHLSFSRCC